MAFNAVAARAAVTLRRHFPPSLLEDAKPLFLCCKRYLMLCLCCKTGTLSTLLGIWGLVDPLLGVSWCLCSGGSLGARLPRFVLPISCSCSSPEVLLNGRLFTRKPMLRHRSL